MASSRPQTETSASHDVEARLREELAEQQEALARLSDEYAVLLEDPSVLQEDRDSTRILLEQTRGAVADLARALAQVHDGDVGRCHRCGAAIPQERLEAIPGVDTCVRCAV